MLPLTSPNNNLMTKEKTIQEHQTANENGKKRKKTPEKPPKIKQQHKRKINTSLLIQAHRNSEKIELDRA